MDRRLLALPVLLLLSACQWFDEREGDGSELPADLRGNSVAIAEEAKPGNPLRPGVYVLEGDSCAAPTAGAFRVVTGEGISGADTRDCQGDFVSQDGPRYSVAQSCTQTGSGQPTQSEFLLKIEEGYAFSLTEGEETRRFQRCEDNTIPPWLGAQLASSSGLVRVTIVGFECDEECYLVFRRSDGAPEAQRAVCNAPACTPWREAQAIPADYRGRQADIELSAAPQRVAEDVEREPEVPAVIRVRIVGPVPESAQPATPPPGD